MRCIDALLIATGLLYGRVDEAAAHLQSEEVALQAVPDEDGLGPEHAEQHSLNISQSDGGALQVFLRDA